MRPVWYNAVVLYLQLMLAQEGASVNEQSNWKDALQLAEAIDVSPSLVSTQQLAIKIVAGEVSGQIAVETAQLLQGHGLLEPRLFVSTLMKVAMTLINDIQSYRTSLLCTVAQ